MIDRNEGQFEAAIIGGGPAGLSAALVLGRCRRRVLVCDAGRPRNARAHRLGGFLTRDGEHPTVLRTVGREQLAAYPAVELRETEVSDAERTEVGFRLRLADETMIECRKLLIATGVVDRLPEI